MLVCYRDQRKPTYQPPLLPDLDRQGRPTGLLSWYPIRVEILFPRQQLAYKQASLERLGLKNLQEYRDSDWWKWFKQDYYKRHKNAYFCVDCGARHGLEIDHEDYRDLGREKDWQVRYRCDACHVEKHRKWNAIARAEMDNEKPALPVKARAGWIRWVKLLWRVIHIMFFW